jgi:diamine N-acetyltransferase
VRLEGERVTLRPFRPEEADLVWESLLKLDRSIMPVPPKRQRIDARVAGSGALSRREIDLAIDVDGRLVGDIQTYRPPGRLLGTGVFEFGIVLYDPTDRGRGWGSEAITLLTSWLFEHAGARRVQAGTESSNGPMRRTLERLGFEHRGRVTDFGRHYLLYVVTPARWLATGSRASKP